MIDIIDGPGDQGDDQEVNQEKMTSVKQNNENEAEKEPKKKRKKKDSDTNPVEAI